MKRALHIYLLTLFCAVLSGCSSAPIKSPDATFTSGGTPRELWESCVRLIHPDGGASVSDLQTMFEQPRNLRELLKNLKLAWERDLLVQPSFFDPAILRKFFNGAEVTAKTPGMPLTQDVGFVVRQLDSNVARGMSARVESRCWKTDYPDAAGHPASKAYIAAFLSIDGGPFPELTLQAVRDVFGQETENVIDQGVGNHGNLYTPIDKGSVVYRDPARARSEGVVLGTTFFFDANPSRRGTGSFEKISDDDVVQRIAMQEAQHRLVEK
jgi:hypothetical protein